MLVIIQPPWVWTFENLGKLHGKLIMTTDDKAIDYFKNRLFGLLDDSSQCSISSQQCHFNFQGLQ
jgi:hypothetical protein